MRLRIDMPNDVPSARRSCVLAVCTVPEPSITECLAGSARMSKIAWPGAAMTRSALKMSEEPMAPSLSPPKRRVPHHEAGTCLPRQWSLATRRWASSATSLPRSTHSNGRDSSRNRRNHDHLSARNRAGKGEQAQHVACLTLLGQAGEDRALRVDEAALTTH